MTTWTPPDALIDQMCSAYFDAKSEDCHVAMRAAVEASGMGEVVEALRWFADEFDASPIHLAEGATRARAALVKIEGDPPS